MSRATGLVVPAAAACAANGHHSSAGDDFAVCVPGEAIRPDDCAAR